MLTCSIAIVRALFTDYRYLIGVNRAGCAPLVICTLSSNALPSLIKVVNELPLIILATNDALLGAEESRRNHCLARAGLLRRSI